jgi:quinone-modifying oxidoreductase subunit QmoC
MTGGEVTVEGAGRASQKKVMVSGPDSRPPDSEFVAMGDPVLTEPDTDFIHRLSLQGGLNFMKCMQCGTCSATCAISPDVDPFPRKELAWARWGMKNRLMADADIWLCYQCQDCSEKCPRSARPGEILGAIRQECITHYSFPQFLARWVNQPQAIPLLLGIPVALLSLALFLVEPIENALGLSADLGDRIIYSYSNTFPHWMLNSFFAFFGLLVLIVMIAGVSRMWKTMKTAIPQNQSAANTRGLGSSIMRTLKKVIMHSDFDQCTTTRPRQISHICVLFGFLALFAVSLWVITAKYNPLIYGDFVYPFGFWSPWKILANLGGLALVGGCVLMIRNRYQNKDLVGLGGYFDWTLISVLLLATFTGFVTEVLHYLRLEPHRHIAYFVHLALAFTVLVYLPYSKLAHMVYRTTALVFAEYSGRTKDDRISGESQEAKIQEKEMTDHEA